MEESVFPGSAAGRRDQARSLVADAAAGLVLAARRISKRFDSVQVLHAVDFDLRPGEVHALMGENGAGKSTLMKILAGVLTEFDGELLIDNAERRFRNVRDAEHAGIAIIHQELSLVRELTVADNIFLGREPLIGNICVDRKRMVHAARELLIRLGIDIDPDRRIAGLRVGEQQLVEIARALSLQARILIMDEPTSALSSAECAILFKVVRQLAATGVAIVYISHRLDEVTELADRVTVLRDGRHVVTAPMTEMTHASIIKTMVGREVLAPSGASVARGGTPLLSVRDLTLDLLGQRGWRRVLHGISFDVYRGEVLGIGGLLGAGRTEILESIYGASTGERGGTIAVGGRTVEIGGPVDARRHRIALVTEDRKVRGLHLASSILENVTLPSTGFLSRFGLRQFGQEKALTEKVVKDLTVRCIGIEQVAATLSGGNQQKVVIGKWLATNPEILLLDEPTRGIDVGAKREIYDLIFALARQGLAIVVVSSEMPELLLLSDRILVMCEGRQTGILPRVESTGEAIMQLAAPARSRAQGLVA